MTATLPTTPPWAVAGDTAVPAGVDGLLAGLASGDRASRLLGVRTMPARAGGTAAWPEWVPPVLLEALAARGVAAPWRHQVVAAEAARAGRSVVLSTGTGSGKSLAYLLPAVAAALDPAGSPRPGTPALRAARAAGRRWRAPLAPAGTGRATTLHLGPTKALAADQARAVAELAVPGFRAATVDGDSPPEQRDWARDHAHLVLTNPEMLHHTLLADHARWGRFLSGLRYVVLDECHAYRGVFGAHVALLLRRLRRVAAAHGAEPVFVLASATVADPADVAGRLTGLDVLAVTEDSSPRGRCLLGLWEPPADPATGVRRPAPAEAADLLGELVAGGTQTLAFVRSRRAAETVALAARRRVVEAGLPAASVDAYRGGYLPEDRRALEQGLRARRVLGLAATNALELGIDVSGLDAVVMAGFPGTRASLWQQAGRAGRAGADGLAVLVAREDPLDTYLVHHPELLFDAPLETNVFDPANPHVLAPHLCAAAAELPLRDGELAAFASSPGEPDDVAAARVGGLLGELTAAGVLRRRATGWFWTRTDRASELADLRGTGGRPVALVEDGSGRVLGTVDAASAPSQAHPGAVLLHRGRPWRVLRWEHATGGPGGGGSERGGCERGGVAAPVAAVLVPLVGDRSTLARSVTDIRVLAEHEARSWGAARLVTGTVAVTTRVTSYLVRRASTGEVLGEEPLDMPEQRLATTAVWWTLTPEAVAAAGVSQADLPGAVHAAEHASIGLLPLVAACDRWDVGGVSTACHPDTGLPTVFVHDGLPGGAGFARRGFDAAHSWLSATLDQVHGCGCASGCPSCVQSPKCGNGNHPLDRAGAVALLRAVLAGSGGSGPAGR